MIAGAVLLASSMSTLVYLKNENKADDLFLANVEALAEFETTITCDSGRCGQCFVEEKAWPFYKCNWTGIEADYCDCDKTGWL